MQGPGENRPRPYTRRAAQSNAAPITAAPPSNRARSGEFKRRRRGFFPGHATVLPTVSLPSGDGLAPSGDSLAPSGDSLALLWREAAIERFALFRHFVQQLGRLEAVAVALGKAVAKFDERLCAHAVDVRHRAAGERREAEAKDRADVGLAHVGDHAFLDTARGFERLDRQ